MLKIAPAIVSIALVAIFGPLPVRASDYVANFDDFPTAGVVGPTLTDGGITFSNYDEDLPGQGPFVFCISQPTPSLFGPSLSPP
jgi:hypothetical protein